jgi:hypothetical protein
MVLESNGDGVTAPCLVLSHLLFVVESDGIGVKELRF